MLGLIKRMFAGWRNTKPAPAENRERFWGRVRHFMDVQARYDAAQTTNENLPLWVLTDYLSAKAANSFQVRRTLKLRSRYERDNNSFFKGITRTLATDLIGTGPRLQLRTDSDRANRQIEVGWNRWGKAIGITEKLLTMRMAKIADGEGMGLHITNPLLRRTFGGTLKVDDAVQLDISVLESDQCTTPDPGFVDYFWVDGIVLDRIGNPTEYHILRHHPGDLYVPELNPLDYDRWAPRNVLHWFNVDRPGQVRGVPEITPALELFAMLRRYGKAVLLAAETAADFAAIMESEAPPNVDPGDDINAGLYPSETMPIQRGMITQLPYGAKLSQFQPRQPMQTYDMYERAIIRQIARCLCIPLSLALGDHSNENYSSGRMAHLPYHRNLKVERKLFAERILDKIFAAWLEEAVMIDGLLPRGLDLSELPPHAWHFDAADSIDPVKDAAADKLELENGTTTLAEKYAEKGEEWEPHMRQRAKEIALARELGIPIGDETTAGQPKAVHAAFALYDPDDPDSVDQVIEALSRGRARRAA